MLLARHPVIRSTSPPPHKTRAARLSPRVLKVATARLRIRGWQDDCRFPGRRRCQDTGMCVSLRSSRTIYILTRTRHGKGARRRMPLCPSERREHLGTRVGGGSFQGFGRVRDSEDEKGFVV